jgi:hypothetical protein
VTSYADRYEQIRQRMKSEKTAAKPAKKPAGEAGPVRKFVEDFGSGARQALTNQMPGQIAAFGGQVLTGLGKAGIAVSPGLPANAQAVAGEQYRQQATEYGRGLTRIKDDAGEWSPNVQSKADFQAKKLNTPDGWGAWLGGIAAQTVPTAVALAVPGAQAPMLGAYFAMGSSSAYDDYVTYQKEKGRDVDERKAQLAGLVGGTLEVVFEKIGLDRLSAGIERRVTEEIVESLAKGNAGRAAKIVKRVAKTAGASAGVEGLEETFTELGNIATEFAYRDPSDRQTKEEVAKRLATAFAGGALGGGPIATVGALAREAAVRAARTDGGTGEQPADPGQPEGGPAAPDGTVPITEADAVPRAKTEFDDGARARVAMGVERRDDFRQEDAVEELRTSGALPRNVTEAEVDSDEFVRSFARGVRRPVGEALFDSGSVSRTQMETLFGSSQIGKFRSVAEREKWRNRVIIAMRQADVIDSVAGMATEELVRREKSVVWSINKQRTLNGKALTPDGAKNLKEVLEAIRQELAKRAGAENVTSVREPIGLPSIPPEAPVAPAAVEPQAVAPPTGAAVPPVQTAPAEDSGVLFQTPQYGTAAARQNAPQEVTDGQEAEQKAPERAAEEGGDRAGGTDAGPDSGGRIRKGEEDVVELAGGGNLRVRYAVAEAEDLIPSHDPLRGFTKREGGDPNERPYHDPVEARQSRENVYAIAENPKVRILTSDTPVSTDGPPIVSGGLVVYGGNARTMGMQLAYARYPKSAEKIRDGVMAAAARFGIDASGIRNPVLVRVLSDEFAPGELSRILNESTAAGKGAATEAVSRASKVSDRTVRAFGRMMNPEDGSDPTIREVMADDKNSIDLIRAFVSDGVWSKSDVQRFTSGADYQLNDDGKNAIEKMVLGLVVDDASALSRIGPTPRRHLMGSLTDLLRIVNEGGKDGDRFRAAMMDAAEAFDMWKASKDPIRQFLQVQTYMRNPPGYGDESVMSLLKGMDEAGPRAFRGKVREFAERIGVVDQDETEGLLGAMVEPLPRAKDADEAIRLTFGEVPPMPGWAATEKAEPEPTAAEEPKPKEPEKKPTKKRPKKGDVKFARSLSAASDKATEAIGRPVRFVEASRPDTDAARQVEAAAKRLGRTVRWFESDGPDGDFPAFVDSDDPGTVWLRTESGARADLESYLRLALHETVHGADGDVAAAAGRLLRESMARLGIAGSERESVREYLRQTGYPDLSDPVSEGPAVAAETGPLRRSGAESLLVDKPLLRRAIDWIRRLVTRIAPGRSVERAMLRLVRQAVARQAKATGGRTKFARSNVRDRIRQAIPKSGDALSKVEALADTGTNNDIRLADAAESVARRIEAGELPETMTDDEIVSVVGNELDAVEAFMAQPNDMGHAKARVRRALDGRDPQSFGSARELLAELADQSEDMAVARAAQAVSDSLAESRTEGGDPVMESVDPADVPTEVAVELVRSGVRFARKAQKGSVAWRNDPVTTFRTYSIDAYDKLNKAQRDLESLMGPIADEANALQKARLMPGVLGYQQGEFWHNEVKPLLRRMRKARLSMVDIPQILVAMHAPERNPVVKARNPGVKDISSGMDDKTARDVLALWSADPRWKEAQDIAKRWQAITRGTLRILQDSALVSDAEANEMRTDFPNYVPMKDVPEPHDSLVANDVPDRFSIRGRQMQPTLGRRTKTLDGLMPLFAGVLPHIVRQRESAMAKAYRNAMANTVLRLVDQSNEPGLWEVTEHPMVRDLDRKTGEVVFHKDPKFLDRVDVITVKLDNDQVRPVMDDVDGERVPKQKPFEKGDEVHIVLKDKRIGEILKKADRPVDGTLEAAWNIARMYTHYTRTLAVVAFNPDFTATNPVRDIQTAVATIASDEKIDVPDRRKLAKDYLKSVSSSFPVVFERLRTGDPQAGPVGDKLERYLAAGAKQEMYAPQSFKSLTGQMAGMLERGETFGGKVRILTGKAKEVIVDWSALANETFDNAMRFGIFDALTDHGVSDAKAAEIARDLTVDFSRKGHGQLASVLRSTYAFLNASAQGNDKMLRLLRSKAGRKLLLGYLPLIGSVSTYLAAALAGSDDDEDGKPDLDQIPEYVWQRNLVLPLGDSGYSLTVPAAYGPNVFLYAGRQAARISMGKVSVGQATAEMLECIADTFNPLEGSRAVASPEGAVRAISPDIFDPLIDLMFNRTWSGQPIAPQPVTTSDSTPGSERVWGDEPDVYRRMASALNTLTGGDDVTAGKISPPPSYLRYMVQLAGGSTGKAAERTAVAIASAFGGEAPDLNEIPVVRRFIRKNVDERQAQSDFRELSARSQEIMGRVRRYAEKGNADKVAQILELAPTAPADAEMSKRAQKAIRGLRDEFGMPETTPERRKAIREEIRTIQRTVLRYSRERSAESAP